MLKKHRDNLTKLADYLDALPADYEHFDMFDYNRKYTTSGSSCRLYLQDRRYDCGTVACAVGHGPAAGIRVYGDLGWNSYCTRVFGVDRGENNYAFEYMFGTSWKRYDNTPHGAAARIRTYIDLGGNTPEGWEDKRSAAL